MIVTLALCGTLLASGGLWAPETPTVGETEFVLSLAELESDSLESARMHRASNRKIVVFIPGLRAKRMVRKFKEGPVRVLRVKRLRRGSTISLFTREPARKVFERLKLASRGDKNLSIQMASEKAPTLFPESKDTKKAEAPADVAAPEPTQTAEEQLANKPRLATGSSAMAASGLFGLIIAALSLILWFLKSNRKMDLLDDSIDVVAVKAFGGKHKLALIETCGEKLLLAASEKGVTLLSHVGNHLVPEPGIEAPGGFGGFSIPDLSPVPAATTQAPEEAPVAHRATPAKPLATDLPAIADDESLKMATAKINSGSLSKDLEGLVKLREKRTVKSQKAVNGLAGHLTNRYTSGAAA